MKKKTEEDRIKNKQEKEEKSLKSLLIKYYSHQLTIFQNRIMLNQLKKNLEKENNEFSEIENVEIEIYNYYKSVLEEINKKGLSHLITTCSIIEISLPDKKVDALISCCYKFNIKA